MKMNKRVGVFLTLVLSFVYTSWAEDLSCSAWRLWPDTEAQWKNEEIYLPDEMPLEKLPVNPPTGGWSLLNDRQGIAVQLPSSVEEHFWGKLGLKPYPASYFGQEGPLQSGVYEGVSWWWREFKAPALADGKRLILNFRGARVVAEVYVNEKLCGYSIFPRLPFQADITSAVKPGLNRLALRITAAGGNLQWIEGRTVWGKKRFPTGRAFGGLDAGIHMETRDTVEVSDLAVLNKPNPREVTILVEVRSAGPAYAGPVDLEISRDGRRSWKGQVQVNVPAGGTAATKIDVAVPDAELWDLEKPVLYQAEAKLPNLPDSGASRHFGFRWFTAEGIGKEAKLTLNGKRIVLRSAISFGYWGNNGLFPDQALAEKEIRAAQALGLNCLNFHREIGREIVLDTQDRLGLLRYEEPGTSTDFLYKKIAKEWAKSPQGAVDTSGKGGEQPRDWRDRYCTEIILRMLKRDRSHPSLIIYGLSNETHYSLDNPRIYGFMKQMRELDPSRIILLKSGKQRANQCLLLPYDPSFHIDDGTGYSGWSDVHGGVSTVGGWNDSFYPGPETFTRPKSDPREIVTMGEIQITAVPDNHAQIVNDYRSSGKPGYDRADHETILAAYEKFMDDYGFRGDFKTAGDLFDAIGFKSYFAHQKVVEHMRMGNRIDCIILNSWESTTIDNHSGLVDVHRNFKGDPETLRQANAPELLVIRPHHYVQEEGQANIADVFLINEVDRKGPHKLAVKLLDEKAQVLFQTTRDVTVTGGERYGELLTSGIDFTPSVVGQLQFQASLSDASGKPVLSRTEAIYVVPKKKLTAGTRLALIGNDADASRAIQEATGIRPVELTPETGAVDAIIFAGEKTGQSVVRKPGNLKESLALALRCVRENGSRLIVWPQGIQDAVSACTLMAEAKVLQFDGIIGPNPRNWTGSWYFVRKHWLFDGLPTGCSMDWRYQVSACEDADGLLISAQGLEVAAGYSRDHQPRVGMGASVLPYGKGWIIIFSLPKMIDALNAKERYDLAPPVARRLLVNAIGGTIQSGTR